MAADIEAGIRFTPPYGKSAFAVQMRHAIAAMQDRGVSGDRFSPVSERKGSPAQGLHKRPAVLAERRLNAEAVRTSRRHKYFTGANAPRVAAS